MGPVFIIGIDCFAPFEKGSEQYKWLEETFQSAEYSDHSWKIIYFHVSPFTSGSLHKDNPKLIEQLVPLFSKYNINFVFTGHSHLYERFLHKGVNYIVTGGGGAPLHKLEKDTIPPIQITGAREYHWCDIEASENYIEITVRKNDGEVIDIIAL